MTTEVIPYAERIGALSIVDVRAQVNLIQQVMREVMHKDEHYGVIPGTGTKPTLLKAGAEKLCLTFRLDPQYEIEQKQDGKHLTIMSKCTLWHIPSGQRFGSGMGSCSTLESKYAYRTGKRKCPQCSAEQINKSKFPPKGQPKAAPGWYCYAAKGGCGAEFAHDDPAIMEQATGRVPNEDVADQYNTVLKMANKRSLVAAVLNATAASDIFTRDIEDMPEIPANDRAAGGNSTEQVSSSTAPAASAPAGTETRTETLRRWCNDAHMAVRDILAKAEVQSAEEMSNSDWESAMRMLKKKAASVRQQDIATQA